jgi:hypothetical protein
MATAVLSGVRDFTAPRVSHFVQLVGHVVFTIPTLASAALYTSCDLMTLGTHAYFIKSIEDDSLVILPPKSLSEKSKSAQECIDESVGDIVYSLIRIVNPAAEADLRSAKFSSGSQAQSFAKQLGGYYLALDHTSAGRLVPRFCPIRVFNWVLTQQLKSNDYYLKGSPLTMRARLFSIASGVALAIVGIVCVIFGALATIGAIIAAPFGQFKRINTYAVHLVGMIGFSVNQLHQGVIGFFRPSHLVTPGLLEKKS